MTNPSPVEPDQAPADPPAHDDVMARYAAHEARQAALRPVNKAAVFGVLAGAGITCLTVSFDGCGDSGQIEDISAQAGDVRVALPAGEIEILNAQWEDLEPVRRTLTVERAIENLAYDYLRQVADGWENNEGAYGEFTFEVAGGAITLDYNERHMDVDCTQFEL